MCILNSIVGDRKTSAGPQCIYGCEGISLPAALLLPEWPFFCTSGKSSMMSSRVSINAFLSFSLGHFMSAAFSTLAATGTCFPFLYCEDISFCFKLFVMLAHVAHAYLSASVRTVHSLWQSAYLQLFSLGWNWRHRNVNNHGNIVLCAQSVQLLPRPAQKICQFLRHTCSATFHLRVIRIA